MAPPWSPIATPLTTRSDAVDFGAKECSGWNNKNFQAVGKNTTLFFASQNTHVVNARMLHCLGY